MLEINLVQKAEVFSAVNHCLERKLYGPIVLVITCNCFLLPNPILTSRQQAYDDVIRKFLLKKMNFECRLQNGGHFVSASTC